ncbi:MAG: 23S rRNA pseudouridine(1911/1915/1917) synthase RluD [Pseudomonadota bacterium]|nr:23S rRNA pseudouridine(1911/1915/1917) synthase RluD [Pseudomonadota bacterium]
MKNHINFLHCAKSEDCQFRIDQLLSEHLKPYSRSQIQNWIKSGNLKINGETCLIPKQKPQLGDQIHLEALIDDHSSVKAQPILLDKIYEDSDILLINKPSDLIVHPGAGNPDGTLMNALLFDCPQLSKLPRAGIVHRLDKNTTGIMIIAKTFESYHTLTQMLADRNIQREYIAIVDGNLKSGLTIDKPIARHKTSRQKMAVCPNGKPAISHVSLLNRFLFYTLVKVKLETGRTHQIRVHLNSIGHPVLGDPTYGKHKGYQKLDPELAQTILSFKRQALHAHILTFNHPITNQPCQYTAPIPSDMQALIEGLKQSTHSTH